MLLLVGVASALDEEQAVLGGSGHVRVDVAEEAGGGAVGEVLRIAKRHSRAVVGIDDQGTGVGDLRDLAEVAVDASDGYQHCVGPAISSKQHAIK